MMIEESLAAARRVLEVDRNPNADEILEATKARLEKMDCEPAIRTFLPLSDEEARARWRSMVTQEIRRQTADLRPS